MTLLQEERPLRSDAPATTRPDPEFPAGPPPEPVPTHEWRWVPDPAEAEPPARPRTRDDRLLWIYAWARTIGF
jgi:hypothetical protein